MDIQIEDHGSIVLFTAWSDRAVDWLAENVSDSQSFWAGALAIAPRYANDIIAGAICDGLEVQ